VENLPHVVGKPSAAMCRFMDGLGKRGEGLVGKEKFCITRNFPGRPCFGMMERGEDWNGPKVFSIKGRGKGPM